MKVLLGICGAALAVAAMPAMAAAPATTAKAKTPALVTAKPALKVGAKKSKRSAELAALALQHVEGEVGTIGGQTVTWTAVAGGLAAITATGVILATESASP